MNLDSSFRKGKKRPRTSTEDREEDDDNGKRKGRPRLDGQAASAADRRRTQIRLAQRAYRQRKESTLDDLRSQVSDLRETVWSMTKALEDFTAAHESWHVAESSIIIKGLRQFINHYKKVTRNLYSSRELATSSADDFVRRTSLCEAHSSGIPETSELNSKVEGSLDQNLGCAVDNTTSLQPHTHQIPAFASQQVPKFNDGNVQALWSGDPHQSPIVTASIQAPSTYSYHETSFARRLHRASTELAYRLTCNPGRAPAKFQRIFEYWMKWVPSIKHVQEQLRASLAAGVDEPLSLWHFPLSHVGGAGTHFPRREVRNGPWKTRPDDEQWNVRLTSAPSLTPAAALETLDSQSAMLQMIGNDPGLQGEWYDAHDVEGYLTTKGIKLDPQALFIDVHLPVGAPSGFESGNEVGDHRRPSQQTSSSSPGSVFYDGQSTSSDTSTHKSMYTTTTTTTTIPSPSFQYANNINCMGMVFPVAGYTNMAAAGGFVPQATQAYVSGQANEMGFTYGTNYTSTADYNKSDNISDNNNNHTLTSIPVPQSTRLVTIDVAKLITTIARTAQCLGRTPGYHRHQVDEALYSSIIDDDQ
ncbi:hypothetical protein AAFC00_006870 [Neodothiora populina]|uniref:BZIP domain-containing protein n=1 Tax=Neodothiora populina TaxID=2781224 RepID=A0ABR3PBF7_9PEZI